MALRKLDSALCGLVLLISVRALAGDVLLLKSQNNDANNQALAGFRRTYSGKVDEEVDLRGSDSRKNEVSRKISVNKPRMIVAVGPLAAEMARAEAKNISVIFLMVSNPARRGLKGDNIAGVSLDIPISRQFAKFKELLPTLKTIGVIYNPSKSSAVSEQAPSAAKQLDLELMAVPVDSPDDVTIAFTLINETVDALWVVPDETFVTDDWFKFLLRETNRRRLPFLTISENFVERGALAAVTPDYFDIGRQSAELLKEIESGKQRPSEVGTVPPDKVNWVVNKLTAKKIELPMPRQVLESASKVY